MHARRLNEAGSAALFTHFMSRLSRKPGASSAFEDLTKYVGLWDAEIATMDRDVFIKYMGMKNGTIFELFLRGYLGSDEFPISDMANEEWRRYTVDTKKRARKVDPTGKFVQYKRIIDFSDSRLTVYDEEVSNLVSNPQFYTSNHSWTGHSTTRHVTPSTPPGIGTRTGTWTWTN